MDRQNLARNGDGAPGFSRRRLRRSIASQRDALLDWEIVVADAQGELDTHLTRLRAAVRDRDRAAQYLSYLLHLSGDGQRMTEWLGPEAA